MSALNARTHGLLARDPVFGPRTDAFKIEALVRGGAMCSGACKKCKVGKKTRVCAKAGVGRSDVSFSVMNTGGRAGADVAQVYAHDGHAPVPRPAKELKGFAKVWLQPGETSRVTVTLDRRAFSYYDVGAKQWRAAPGDFEILVGRSSEQIELRGTLAVRPY